jgi:hypothetical protein
MVILLSESFRMQDQDQEFNGMRDRIFIQPYTRAYIIPCTYSSTVWRAWVCDFFFFYNFLFLHSLIIRRWGTHARVRSVTRKNK